MTPTEQDKGLRDLLEQNGWKFYEELNGFRKESKFTIPMFSTDQSKNYDTLSAGNYYELAQLITADRKRVALEARIDEINYLDDNFQVDSQDWEREHPGYSTAMIPMEDYIRRRTELKAQQEEVK